MRRGFEPVSIAGTEILANVKAIQNVRMRPSDTGGEEEEVFVIPAHTLYGDYPPKIAEDEIKPHERVGGDRLEQGGRAGVYCRP